MRAGGCARARAPVRAQAREPVPPSTAQKMRARAAGANESTVLEARAEGRAPDGAALLPPHDPHRGEAARRAGGGGRGEVVGEGPAVGQDGLSGSLRLSLFLSLSRPPAPSLYFSLSLSLRTVTHTQHARAHTHAHTHARARARTHARTQETT